MLRMSSHQYSYCCIRNFTEVPEFIVCLATWWLLLHAYEPTTFLSFMLRVRILETFTGEHTHACAYISALHQFGTLNSYLCLCFSTLLAARTATRDVLLQYVPVILHQRNNGFVVFQGTVLGSHPSSFFCIPPRICKWRPRTNQHNLELWSQWLSMFMHFFLHLPCFQHN